MEYTVIRINENSWRIEEDSGVRFFLLTGTERALLVDAEEGNSKGVQQIVAAVFRFRSRLFRTPGEESGDNFHMGYPPKNNTYDRVSSIARLSQAVNRERKESARREEENHPAFRPGEAVFRKNYREPLS